MSILQQGKYDQQNNVSNISFLLIRLQWVKWIQAHWSDTAAFGWNSFHLREDLKRAQRNER